MMTAACVRRSRILSRQLACAPKPMQLGKSSSVSSYYCHGSSRRGPPTSVQPCIPCAQRNCSGVYIAGSGFQAWAISVNLFYSPVIHIQAELGHSVITRGPYRILRHPAYFANIVAIPASALAIGSWMGLIPATLFCAITIWRARREDAFLQQRVHAFSSRENRSRSGRGLVAVAAVTCVEPSTCRPWSLCVAIVICDASIKTY